MKTRLAWPRGILLATVATAAACSGGGGHGDAGLSEAGGVLDAETKRLDGAAPVWDAITPSADLSGPGPDLAGPGFDVTAAKYDAASDPGRADVAASEAGSDAGSRDLPGPDAGSRDRPQMPPEVGSPREVAADLAPDAPSVTPDTAPATSTGNAIADRLAAAAAACGPQSRLTVPVGWQMVPAGELGCAFYAPAGWLTIGAGTPMTFAVEDQSRLVGSSVMAGVDSTGTATCTPHGVATWLFANNQDCVGFKELYWKDGVDVVAGIQIPRGDLVYSCTQSGTPIAGYLVVQIHGTWPMCNILAFAFWMPETQIEARTCTLTQTLNSIQCPQGGTGCDDAQCRQECVASGNASGACASDDSCYCTN